MTNRLARALNRLAVRLAGYASVSIRYQRGSATVTLTASVGRTGFQQTDQQSLMLIRSESRDFLFQAADLVLDGTPTLPRSGDRILQTINGREEIFEAMSVNGEPCFRSVGSDRERLRVYTRHVETL